MFLPVEAGVNCNTLSRFSYFNSVTWRITESKKVRREKKLGEGFKWLKRICRHELVDFFFLHKNWKKFAKVKSAEKIVQLIPTQPQHSTNRGGKAFRLDFLSHSEKVKVALEFPKCYWDNFVDVAGSGWDFKITVEDFYVFEFVANVFEHFLTTHKAVWAGKCCWLWVATWLLQTFLCRWFLLLRRIFRDETFSSCDELSIALTLVHTQLHLN